MALFDHLMNCGENLVDQDWNHWKLQMKSWMEDVKEQERQSRSGPSAGPQSCGSAHCGQKSAPNCGTSRDSEQMYPGLEALHGLWAQFANRGPGAQRQTREDPSNQVKSDAKKMVIKLDVQNFDAQEISVKIVDNFIVVSGEHPEKADRLSLISRKFQRRYELPADVEADTIVSTLTPDGVLIIEGLKKFVPREAGAEIVIPVQREQTNASDDQQEKYASEEKMD
ncbi:unnamed protein product [Medioppia subpectinata]|uniref:SHSP domain-containing protein n=1 Tax=Medioppia subpectinata TaxID=1979941 RepID=A0A7R9PZ47_9ACAR|nr:unnamed protein product [Medioppia subpectinata]CAG2105837.1 unnamed protein product [Medioppia subpectinata]